MTLYATWLSVVIGCGIVLLFIATQGPHAVQTDLQFFAAGGLPVVVRSLWLTGAHLWAWDLVETPFGAHGFEGQRVIAFPARDVVVVRLGKIGEDDAPALNDHLAEIAACFPLR